jgi:hypothetical protein
MRKLPDVTEFYTLDEAEGKEFLTKRLSSRLDI